MADTITRQEAVERVMERFDFQKVHEYMKAVNWRWAKENMSFGIPSVDDLKRAAREMLIHAVNSPYRTHSMCSTGGFEARVDGWDERKPSLVLNFIPFSSEVWGLCDDAEVSHD